MANDTRIESSHLGKSLQFKGDISGAEDIFIDGKVEGTVQLANQVVTVGPQGSVSAEVQARDLIIQGTLNGNARAKDRIEVSRSGSVRGDLAMTRISIQDGAFIQGRVDVQVAGEPAAAPKKVSAAAAAVPAGVPIPSPEPASEPEQASFLDRKL